MIQVHTDVAIIGGSFAGLSAALQLSRGRRRVTLFDTGQPATVSPLPPMDFWGKMGKAPMRSGCVGGQKFWPIRRQHLSQVR